MFDCGIVGKQLILEAEPAHIVDALGVKDAVEMIALMLHHPRVKILYLPFYGLSLCIETTVTNVPVARHLSAHTRHAEATFPILFHFLIQELYLRVYQYRQWYRLTIRIARVMVKTEHHHPLQYTNLIGRQAGAIGSLQSIKHIPHQRMQFGRVKLCHSPGRLQQ
jgi:hypothetical protein